MNLVAAVQPAQRHPVPEDYPDWPIRQKLAFVKSRIPAVTHVDFSARIQTVERARNFRLWRLIHTFKQQTGCGLLINTSFNGRDEPIVCTPDDAIACFLRTEWTAWYSAIFWSVKNRHMEFLNDLWQFLKVRKKWWLAPVILTLILIGALLFFSSGSALSPYIYSLF